MGDGLTVAVIAVPAIKGRRARGVPRALTDHTGSNRHDAGLHVAMMEFLELGMNPQDAFAMMVAVDSAAFYFVLRLLWRHKPRD